MTLTGQAPSTRNIVQRATNIILRPSSEWAVIDAEPATVQGLFTGYAMILAAIGPICSLIGSFIFLLPTMGALGVHLSPVGLIINAIVSYVVSLVGVFVFGLVIDALAPNFGGVKNQVQAMKVAVYTATPGWLCGVFGLVPLLGFLALLGLYGLFLLYKGQNIVMRSPQDKTMGYTAVTVIVMIVVWVILGGLVFFVGTMTGAAAGLAGMAHPAVTSTTITTTNP